MPLRPAVSPIQQSKRDSVGKRLQEYSEDEKQVLRYLLQHGQVEQMRLRASCGVPFEAVAGALPKAKAHQIIKTVYPSRQGYPHHWEINPELHDALRFHLLGD